MIFVEGGPLEVTSIPLGEAYNDPTYVTTDRRTPRVVIQRAGPVDLLPRDIIQVSGRCQATHDIWSYPRDGGAVIMAGWSVLRGVPDETGLDPKPASASPVIRKYTNTNWDAWRHHESLPYDCLWKPLVAAQPGAFIYVTLTVGWNPDEIVREPAPAVTLAGGELRVLVHRPSDQ